MNAPPLVVGRARPRPASRRRRWPSASDCRSRSSASTRLRSIAGWTSAPRSRPFADRERVPHHGIDLLDPADSYSAARSSRTPGRGDHAIRARGRIPVLVGGTMLYLKALRDGLDDMPAIPADVREAIEREGRRRRMAGALHRRLAAIDPVTAARLAPLDAQRISRALEVWRGSGRTLSSFHGARPSTNRDLMLLSLEPSARGELHAASRSASTRCWRRA